MKSVRKTCIRLASAMALLVLASSAFGQSTGKKVSAAASRERAIESLTQSLRARPSASKSAASSLKSPRFSTTPRGFVRNALAPATAIFPVAAPGKDAEATARAFLAERGAAFVPQSPKVGFAAKSVKTEGDRGFVRLTQNYGGVPVWGAEMMIQTEGDRGVSYVSSDVMRDTKAFDSGAIPLKPTLDGGNAAKIALSAVAVLYPDFQEPDLQAAAPTLMIYDPVVVGDSGPARLVWQTVVTHATAPKPQEFVLIDAHTGDLAEHHSVICGYMDRVVYDADGFDVDPGARIRYEGNNYPSGLGDADLAFDSFGDTYLFYWWGHGRDSIDDDGMTIYGTVRHPAASNNAFWDGKKMFFGQEMATDDICGHELTHGVTQYTSELIYKNQSGAINESFSDMWGEWIDQWNGWEKWAHNTGLRWLMGEDSGFNGNGAIRNMADPPEFWSTFSDGPANDPLYRIPHPDRMRHYGFYTGSQDQGGVHHNSGVGNKLCYLLSDGGDFNGFTIDGLGNYVAADLFYQCQANLLTAGADYEDLSFALLQAAGYMGLNQDNILHACTATEIATMDAFKITYKGCELTVEDGVSLRVLDVNQGKVSIKIQKLAKLPPRVTLTDNHETSKRGITYLISRSIPEVNIHGSVAKFYTEVPIEDIISTGTIKSLVAKNAHVSRIRTTGINKVKMTTTPQAGRSWVRIATNGLPLPAKFKRKINVNLVGIGLADLEAPDQAAVVKVASKKTEVSGVKRFVAVAGVTNVWAGDSLAVTVKGGNVIGSIIARGQIKKIAATKLSASLEGIIHDIGGRIGHPEEDFGSWPDDRKDFTAWDHNVWIAAGESSWLLANRLRGSVIGNIKGTLGVMATFVAGYDTWPENPTFALSNAIGSISTTSRARGGDGTWGIAAVRSDAKIRLRGDTDAINANRLRIIDNMGDLRPGNDNFAEATPLTVAVGTTTGDNAFATAEPSEPTHDGRVAVNSVWWAWTAPTDGFVTFNTFDSAFDTILAVYTGASLDTLTSLTSNNNAYGLQSEVFFDAIAGETYWIAVDGYYDTPPDLIPATQPRRGDQMGAIILTWDFAAKLPNDDFQDAIPLPTFTGTTYGSNYLAGLEPGEQIIWPVATGQTVWWKFMRPTSGTLWLSTNNSSFDTYIYVAVGNSVDNLTYIAENADNFWTGAETSYIEPFPVVGNVTYYICIDGEAKGSASSGDVTLSWGFVPVNDEVWNPTDLPVTSWGQELGTNEGATNGLYRGEWFDPNSDTYYYDTTRADLLRGLTYPFSGPSFWENSRPWLSIAWGDPILFDPMPPVDHVLFNYGPYIYRDPDSLPIQTYSSVWYRWRNVTTNTVVFSTQGSNFDTFMAAYLTTDTWSTGTQTTVTTALTMVGMSGDINEHSNYYRDKADGRVYSQLTVNLIPGSVAMIQIASLIPQDIGDIYLSWYSYVPDPDNSLTGPDDEGVPPPSLAAPPPPELNSLSPPGQP